MRFILGLVLSLSLCFPSFAFSASTDQEYNDAGTATPRYKPLVEALAKWSGTDTFVTDGIVFDAQVTGRVVPLLLASLMAENDPKLEPKLPTDTVC